jgi:hypothetical protein
MVPNAASRVSVGAFSPTPLPVVHPTLGESAGCARLCPGQNLRESGRYGIAGDLGCLRLAETTDVPDSSSKRLVNRSYRLHVVDAKWALHSTGSGRGKERGRDATRDQGVLPLYGRGRDYLIPGTGSLRGTHRLELQICLPARTLEALDWRSPAQPREADPVFTSPKLNPSGRQKPICAPM